MAEETIKLLKVKTVWRMNGSVKNEIKVYHSDGRRSEHFQRRQSRVESHVRHDVRDSHENKGNGNGSWKIPTSTHQKSKKKIVYSLYLT